MANAQALTRASEYLHHPPAQPTLARLADSIQKRGIVATTRMLAWNLCTRVLGSPALNFKDRLWMREARNFDRRHGVQTAGWIAVRDLTVAGSHAAAGSDYVVVRPLNLLREVLQIPRIDHRRFTFIDFGSGMGRVLLIASEDPYRAVIGVEFSAELHAQAQANIAACRAPRNQCRDVQSVCISAEEFPIPSGDLVLFFANPFGPSVMEPLLRNLRQAMASEKRTVWILYVKPRCGFLMDAQPMLEKVSESLLADYWYAAYKSKSAD